MAPAVVYSRCRTHSVARLEGNRGLAHQKYKAVKEQLNGIHTQIKMFETCGACVRVCFCAAW